MFIDDEKGKEEKLIKFTLKDKEKIFNQHTHAEDQ